MNQLEQFKEVETFIFDVDGVLTDGKVHILENGQLLRQMNIRDGYALKLAVQKGYHVCVITGGKSEGVKRRLQNLGIQNIYLGASDKQEAFEEFISLYNLDPIKVLYMGDDIPDYSVMKQVGLPACPQDATMEIIRIAAYVSPFRGGQGCARDVIEKVMRLQETWQED